MTDQYKIIFTELVGASKTTAIAAIRDIVLFSIEQAATDETKNKSGEAA